jgi:SAM-dependent methyltransferase
MKILTNLLFDYHNDCVDINGELVHKRLFTKEEADNYKAEVMPVRLDLEKEIKEELFRHADKKFVLDGYSESADTFVQFNVDLDYSDGKTPNFRERLVCPLTKLNNRQRFICCFTQKMALERKYSSIFIHEQSTPVYKFINSQLHDVNILGAEFIAREFKPGQMLRGLRHEDPTALTFDDESFDMVLSCDILSKVADLGKAASELSRVTRSGGALIFSIPFSNESGTVRRAKVENKEVINLKEPIFYHNQHTGRQDGVVFYEIGWDFFDLLKENGFKNVYQLAYYSATFGYLGEGYQSIFVAEK